MDLLRMINIPRTNKAMNTLSPIHKNKYGIWNKIWKQAEKTQQEQMMQGHKPEGFFFYNQELQLGKVSHTNCKT